MLYAASKNDSDKIPLLQVGASHSPRRSPCHISDVPSQPQVAGQQQALQQPGLPQHPQHLPGVQQQQQEQHAQQHPVVQHQQQEHGRQHQQLPAQQQLVQFARQPPSLQQPVLHVHQLQMDELHAIGEHLARWILATITTIGSIVAEGKLQSWHDVDPDHDSDQANMVHHVGVIGVASVAAFTLKFLLAPYYVHAQ
jgi:hypothetical protein